MIRELHGESESLDWISLLKWNLIEAMATALFLMAVASRTDLSLTYDPILQKRFEKSLPMSIFFGITLFGITIWIIKILANYLLLTYTLRASHPVTDAEELFSASIHARKYPIVTKLALAVGFMILPKGDYVPIIQRRPLVDYIVSNQLFAIVGIITLILCVSEIIGYSYLELRGRKIRLMRLDWTLIIIAEAVFLPV